MTHGEITGKEVQHRDKLVNDLRGFRDEIRVKVTTYQKEVEDLTLEIFALESLEVGKEPPK